MLEVQEGIIGKLGLAALVEKVLFYNLGYLQNYLNGSKARVLKSRVSAMIGAVELGIMISGSHHCTSLQQERKQVDNPATVYVVDDDRELLQALRWLLESAHFGVETFGAAQEFIDAYDPAKPGCLLLDVRMPGMSGIELQQVLKSQNKNIPIVFLTGHGDVPMAVQCLNSGGFHFLEKPFKDEELLDRISAALRRDGELRHDSSQRTEASTLLSQLTCREREVMQLLLDGLTNRRVASRLDISEKTVAAHRSNLMRRLGATSLVDLVRLARTAQDTTP